MDLIHPVTGEVGSELPLALELPEGLPFDEWQQIGERLCARSDYLFYHFLDVDKLYILNLWHLQRWAFGYRDEPANLYGYRQVVQKRYSQANETVGRLVPVADIAAFVRVIHPRQASFLEDAA